MTNDLVINKKKNRTMFFTRKFGILHGSVLHAIDIGFTNVKAYKNLGFILVFKHNKKSFQLDGRHGFKETCYC